MSATISVSPDAVASGAKRLRASADAFPSSIERPSGPPDTGATQLINRAIGLVNERLLGLSAAMRHEAGEAADNVDATASELVGVDDENAALLNRISAELGGARAPRGAE